MFTPLCVLFLGADKDTPSFHQQSEAVRNTDMSSEVLFGRRLWARTEKQLP